MFGKKTFIVMEHEEGLLFKDGRLVQKVGPGKYVRWGKHFKVQTFDKRMVQLVAANQEITCADGISLKLSARMDYRTVDIDKWYRSSNSPQVYLYTTLHEAVRDIVSALPVEEVMAQRQELSARLRETISPKAVTVGAEVIDATIRDLAVSGEIKRAYGQVIVAQKEAQAALERARGESAALRNLANAAKMMDANPSLLQLRWIHALGQTKGATIVLSPGGPLTPISATPDQS